MKKMLRWNSESGAVSFMTVVFFVLFLAVISVSFVSMITNERQRALQNELSDLALAAAESGIEDGKRIILFCMNNPEDETCKEIETADDCDTLIQKFGVSGKKIIGNSLTSADGNEVGTNTVGNEEYAQEYTCLKINRYTDDVEYLINAIDTKNNDVSASVIVPLEVKDDASLSQFVLQWHLLEDIPNGDGKTVNLRANDDNTKKADWDAPAMLRVEMVSVPKSGGFSTEDLINNTSAVYLRPKTSGVSSSDVINIMDYKPATEANISSNPVVGVKCEEQDSYKCTAKLKYNNDAMISADNNYFVKITALYRDTHIKLSLPGGLKFNNLQPQIDVTGKVGNALRRVLTRVATNDAVAGEAFFPEYAIETVSPVCKNMTIREDSGQDNCLYD